MNDFQRQTLESYLDRIEAVAKHAEDLQERVDEPYRLLLQAEVENYRSMLDIWRKRLDQR